MTKTVDNNTSKNGLNKTSNPNASKKTDKVDSIFSLSDQLHSDWLKNSFPYDDNNQEVSIYQANTDDPALQTREGRALAELMALKRGEYIPDDGYVDPETLSDLSNVKSIYEDYRNSNGLENKQDLSVAKLHAPSKAYILDENRHMTIVFCDLVNSSAEVRAGRKNGVDLMRIFQRVGAESMELYGGRIGSRMGDGFVCTFGFRLADENETIRALKASLCMMKEVRSTKGLNVRLSVHIGDVATGIDEDDETDGRDLYEVLGQTVHIGARIESVTPVNHVCVSQPVAELVQEFFSFKSEGYKSLKGFGERPLFRLDKQLACESRFNLQVKHGLTPFVKRTEPLAKFDQAWHDMRTQGPQFLLVEGKAGIGKSRLSHEFIKSHKDDHTIITYIAYCAVEKSEVPFGALIDILKPFFEFNRRDTQAEKVQKIAAAFEGQDLNRIIPVWLKFLDIQNSETYPVGSYAPGEERDILMCSLMAWFITPKIDLPSGEVAKFILQMENFEHVDPSSWDMIRYLMDNLPVNQQFMVILNTRPDLTINEKGLTKIILDQWSAEDSTQLVSHIYENGEKSDELTSELSEHIIRRAGCNPLMIEELIRFYWHNKNKTDVPLSLIELLTYRIMRLGPERNLLKQASLLGDHVSLKLLKYHFNRRFVGKDHGDCFYTYLETLLADGIIAYNQGHKGIYFAHGLHQEVTYNTFHPWDRPGENQRVAESLLAFHKDQPNQLDYALIATYFEKAEDYKKALIYYHKAIGQAMDSGAYDEVIRVSHRAIELFDKVHHSKAMLNIMFSIRLSLSKGYKTKGVYFDLHKKNLDALSRSIKKLEKKEYESFLLLEYYWVNLVNNNFKKSDIYARCLLEKGKKNQSFYDFIVGYTSLGMNVFYQGDNKQSYAYLKKAEKVYALGDLGKKPYFSLDPILRLKAFLAYPCLFLDKLKELESHLGFIESTANYCEPMNRVLLMSAYVHLYVILNKPYKLREAIDFLFYGGDNNKPYITALSFTHITSQYWLGLKNEDDFLENKENLHLATAYIKPYEELIKVRLYEQKRLYQKAVDIIDDHFSRKWPSCYLDSYFLFLKAKFLYEKLSCQESALKVLGDAYKMALSESNTFSARQVIEFCDKYVINLPEHE